jgi:argininosuccinate lyase
VAEDLVRDGAPFRDAHEQVAAEVRAETFEPLEGSATRHAPGPEDVAGAVAAARARLAV